MKARPVLTLAAAVALLVAPRALEVSANQDPALLLGRVVDASTGQPMSSTVVRLSSGGAPIGPGALTGADGRFVFAPVKAGSFSLTTERPGYFDSAYGKRRPLGDGRPLIVGAGEHRGDLTIQMWRWASIAGTVIDDVGTRVPGVEVQAIRRGPTGAAATGEVVTAVTDAHGEYRIQRLAPGSYAVAVSSRILNVSIPSNISLPSSAVTPPAPGSGDPTFIIDAIHRSLLAIAGPVREPRDPRERDHPFVYVTSYYGGATNLWQAKPVDVTLGQPVSNIDIAVALRTSVRIAGAVVGPRGPVGQALVRLLSTDIDADKVTMQTPDVVAAITGDDGKFTFPPVAAGNYLLDAFRPRPAPTFAIDASGVPRLSDLSNSSRDPEGYWTRTSLSVTNRDIPDFVVTMRAGVKISGQTTFERPPAADAGPFRLVLQRAGEPPVTSSAVRADRVAAFELTGIKPGSYVLEAAGLPEGWEISSAVLGGRDITATPFDVGSADLSGLVVTLGDRAIEIRGDVADAQGRLVSDATVAIFSGDMASWKNVSKSSKHVQTMRATNGGYAFRGLAAGDYYVVALDDAMMDDWPAPELLRKLLIGTERIRVTAGERRVVNVTVRSR